MKITIEVRPNEIKELFQVVESNLEQKLVKIIYALKLAQEVTPWPY